MQGVPLAGSLSKPPEMLLAGGTRPNQRKNQRFQDPTS